VFPTRRDVFPAQVAALQALARRAADSRADDAEARALAATRSTALPQHENAAGQRASIALAFLSETGQGNTRLASALDDETLAAFLDSALPAAQQQLAREVSPRPGFSAARSCPNSELLAPTCGFCFPECAT
jgi:hypothetical protein